jgi:hypothetical protein
MTVRLAEYAGFDAVGVAELVACIVECSSAVP